MKKVAMGIGKVIKVICKVVTIILLIAVVAFVTQGKWKPIFDQARHDMNVRSLTRLEVKIKNDLESGKFDDALKKANELNYTANGWSEKREWENKKEDYISSINALKTEEEKRIQHEMKLQELIDLEASILADVENEKFDDALKKAEQLCYTLDNKEEQKVWNTKREERIKFITESKREYEINSPDYISIPKSSSKYRGDDANTVKEQLNSIGLNNVVLKASSDKANLLHKEGTVESIVVDGKEKFSTEDYFHKDTLITIYYYTK